MTELIGSDCMNEKISIDDAIARLSELVDRAASGEEIIITRRGCPIARLTALRSPGDQRKPGRLRGRVRIRRNFDESFPKRAVRL
jgi:prevent-host-death family protein